MEEVKNIALQRFKGVLPKNRRFPSNPLFNGGRGRNRTYRGQDHCPPHGFEDRDRHQTTSTSSDNIYKIYGVAIELIIVFDRKLTSIFNRINMYNNPN